jgi:hypothetical protein
MHCFLGRKCPTVCLRSSNELKQAGARMVIDSAAMKKATNPLALDLRAGGFEVFPLAKLFDLPSNVWYPSILIRENMLAEPLAAWAANVFYALLQWSDAAFFYAPIIAFSDCL